MRIHKIKIIKTNEKIKYTERYSLKSLIFVFIIMHYYLEQKIFNEGKIDYIDNNYLYYACIGSSAKLENRYALEFVQHYISIGVEKFFIVDNNDLEAERLSDVLQNYIKYNIVEIVDKRGQKVSQENCYESILKIAQNKCKWILYYDLDEHLEFVDKNMTIKKYLSQNIFKKCDVIKIHWLMYYDNGLINYDNRTLMERFPKPCYHTRENRYHKSIVRVRDYGSDIWTDGVGPHQPNKTFVNMCNALGRSSNFQFGTLGHPNYKFCYLKHYSMKTSEEYALKIKRGEYEGIKLDNMTINKRIKRFFKYNQFSKEKLANFENILNMTFPKYH